MRIRQPFSLSGDKVEMQMTPMIDVVFQLLIFFVLTFKVSAQEGDFSIRMPLAAPSVGVPPENDLVPLIVKLHAGPDGQLTGITLHDQPFESFARLNNYVIGYLGDQRGPGSAQSTAEVELDFDYNLRYEYVIEAITAVSGYVDESTGQIVKLIEKIKFAPPHKPEGDAS